MMPSAGGAAQVVPPEAIELRRPSPPRHARTALRGLPLFLPFTQSLRPAGVPNRL